MMAMEGVATAVAVKLPSFKIIRRTTTLNWRSSRSFRSFSASASTLREGVPSASVSVSLGDFDPTRFLNPQSRMFFCIYVCSQKPMVVLKALQNYYEGYNSNVHRGIHFLSAKATEEYELARKKIASFINASDSREIVFTRNATEAINLVAYTRGLQNLKPEDEIILTVSEHHSAIVPWQFVAQKTVPDINMFKEMLSTKTKLVVVHHISNVLASVLPIEDIVLQSHNVEAKVLVDACQSVPHMVVDVQNLDADFLVASSHKMCGPTGIGFLYGKSHLLSTMPPFLGKFEARTPATGEAIWLGAAIDYLSGIGMQKIHDYKVELSRYLYESLCIVPGVRIYGPAPSENVYRAALCSFNVENIHPMDIAALINRLAIRSGHHCAQPLHSDLGINASAQASLHFYNTKEDVDYFIHALNDTINFFNSF
ncbi:hypothetical protein UlMin_043435 [Ulmus minor]